MKIRKSGHARLHTVLRTVSINVPENVHDRAGGDIEGGPGLRAHAIADEGMSSGLEDPIVSQGEKGTKMSNHKKTFFIGSILVGAIFLSVSTPLPLIAQEATVTLKVCNAAKVDIDVFVSRSGKVSSSHIGPADCAVVAESVGSMGSAYVGFAFADSRGQWGGVRRQDFLPLDSGFLGVMPR